MIPKCFSMETVVTLSRIIGSYKFLGKKSVIGSSFVISLTPELEQLKEYKNPYNTQSSSDLFLQNFLRSYCDCIIHKTSLLKEEPKYMTGHYSPSLLKPDIKRFFYYGKQLLKQENDETLNANLKPILLTGHGLSMDDINNIPIFKSKHFYKYIPSTKGIEDALNKNSQFSEFSKENKIEIIPSDISDISTGINFFLNQKGYENVLLERNVVPLGKYFPDPEADPPVELLFLCVLSQPKIEKKLIGADYPSLSQILEKYSVLNLKTMNHQNNEGHFSIFTLAKKHKKVLNQESTERKKTTHKRKSSYKI